MTRTVLIAICGLATACTTPDMEPGITEATKLLSLTGADIRKQLGPAARSEFLAARDGLIRARKAVVRSDGPCDVAAARLSRQSTAGCRLVELADPATGPINASQVIRALDAMDDYFVVLGALADAKSRAEIQTLTKGLLENVDMLGQAKSGGGLARLARQIGQRRDLIQTGSVALVDQYRYAALRRVMRRADPLIEDITVRIASYYDTRASGSLDAGDALIAARAGMVQARTQGSEAEYRRAIEDFSAALQGVITAEAASPVNRLFLLREAHGALLVRLQNGSLEDYLDSFDQMRDLIQLARNS